MLYSNRYTFSEYIFDLRELYIKNFFYHIYDESERTRFNSNIVKSEIQGHWAKYTHYMRYKTKIFNIDTKLA